MTLDDVVFGNPTMEQLADLRKESYLDVIMPSVRVLSRPSNMSQKTVWELQDLTLKSQELEKHPKIQERYLSYDIDMLAYFKNNWIGQNVDPVFLDKLLENLIDDIMPVITKLKYFYQRPRPYTLAKYYNLPLHCYASYSADSPSYPSGHAFLARILCGVIGTHFPELLKYTQDLSADFNNSRLYMGLHYHSDVEAGVLVAEKCLQNMDFRRKYKI